MRVTRLSTTPVKGLALHHPESIDVDETGARGDRLFFLADDRPSLVSIAKTGALVGVTATYDEANLWLTFSADGGVVAEGAVSPGEDVSADFFAFRLAPGRFVPGPWDRMLSDLAGRHLRLVMGSDALRGHDVEPLTLLGTASTEALGAQAGGAVDARRFRMLIEFSSEEPHVEDTWNGSVIRVGEAELEVGGPVQRCAGTTRNPDSGRVDLRTLQLIGGYRGRQDSIFGPGFNFGVYARCRVPGRIAVGDAVEATDARRMRA